MISASLAIMVILIVSLATAVTRVAHPASVRPMENVLVYPTFPEELATSAPPATGNTLNASVYLFDSTFCFFQ